MNCNHLQERDAICKIDIRSSGAVANFKEKNAVTQAKNDYLFDIQTSQTILIKHNLSVNMRVQVM